MLTNVFNLANEKCMYSRIYLFLTKYKLLSKKLFDFRNNHSTSHALTSLIEVFIDVQKAFDTVDQETLLIKLDFYGVLGLANSWLKPFLEKQKATCQFIWTFLEC